MDAISHTAMDIYVSIFGSGKQNNSLMFPVKTNGWMEDISAVNIFRPLDASVRKREKIYKRIYKSCFSISADKTLLTFSGGE